MAVMEKTMTYRHWVGRIVCATDDLYGEVVGYVESASDWSMNVVHGVNYTDYCPFMNRGNQAFTVREATAEEIARFKEHIRTQASDGTMEMLAAGQRLMAALNEPVDFGDRVSATPAP
jgi:hypothetical protein